MATGTTTVDFGAFPGKGETSVTITGQTTIGSGSLVEAWVFPVATSDHTVDEHYQDPPRVMAGEVVAGTGFTIRAWAPDRIVNFAYSGRDNVSAETEATNLLYGQYTVAWAWV